MKIIKLYVLVAALISSLTTNAQEISWDFDGNDNVDALSDGLLLLRHTFGVRGDALVADAVALDSPHTSAQIEANIDAGYQIADIDNNGNVDALSDGLILLRYMFGLRGETLIADTVSPTATRNTHTAITQYIESHMPSDDSDDSDDSDGSDGSDG